MTHRRSGFLAGALAVLVLLVLVPAAGATTVSVRIVGDAVGVDTAVDTTGVPVPGGCAGGSAGEALDKAVNGDWDRNPFVQTILKETHKYDASDWWTFWINDTFSATLGICDYVVQPGDRILLFVQRDDAMFAGTIFPLTLAGVPATAVAGQPFTVTVSEQRTDGTTTTPVAAAGATVAGGGASAETNAAGQATLTLATPGQVRLRATRPPDVPSDVARVTVSPAPASGPAGATPPAAAPPAPPPPPPPIAKLQAPGAAIVGIEEGQRFRRGEGPRELRVKAFAGAGLHIVKLRLTRNDRGRCSTFSGKTERFRHVKCGAANGFWFGVGDRQDTSYLLPSRLPRGRYVLDVNAIDKAFNRDDARRRGGNRIVFHVG
jgi:hypothetical protein